MRTGFSLLMTAAFAASFAAPSAAQLPISNGFSRATAFDDAFGVGTFIDGGYQIAARRGLSRWFWYNGVIPSSVRIELSTYLRGGPRNEGFGLAFARPSRDVRTWCTFLVDASGRYKLVRWGGTVVFDWTSSSAIRTGIGGRNQLAVEIDGRQVGLYINGTLVNTWTADRDVSGYLGIQVGQGLEVRFSDLTARASGGVAMGGGKGAPVAPSTAGFVGWVEDFSGESPADDSLARAEYADGGLLVNAYRGMTRWLFGRGVVPANARITMNAQFRGGASNAGFGLVFGRPSRAERRWMRFDIEPDGTWFLEGYGGRDNVGPLPTPAVRGGYNTLNALMIEIRGSQVRLYVNGTLLNAYTASRDVAGHLGVHVSQGSQVLFSNLRVEPLY